MIDPVRDRHFREGRPDRVGVGLRSAHHEEFLRTLPAVPWLEAVTENYLGRDAGGGRAGEILARLRGHYPVALHGVSLSIGSTDPLDFQYLKQVRDLSRRLQTSWISDHLCWTGVDGENLHDLLPLPYTEEALTHVCERVLRVQEYLNEPLVLENVSSYLNFTHSEMSEWEFISEVVRRTDCRLLLDINNVYVSATNHCFSALDYLRGVPSEAVVQFHLAGYSDNGNHLVDTHDHPVWPPVWELFSQTLAIVGPRPTLVEWDDNLPALERLLQEAATADRLMEEHERTVATTNAAVAEMGHHAS